ncbi:MAG: hypothetical protein IJ093_01650 [Bacilli bacterium]|nr:hypothetical protein [Bacilli bacterium]
MKDLDFEDIQTFVSMLNDEEFDMLKEVVAEREIEDEDTEETLKVKFYDLTFNLK